MGGGDPDGCCIPIRMHKVCRALGLMQHIVEQISSMQHEVAMRQSRVVSGKHGMSAPDASTKGGVNKYGRYTITYAPGSERNKTS